MIVTEMGRGDESMVRYSSRALAVTYASVENYPDAQIWGGFPSQGDIFSMTETSNATLTRPAEIAPSPISTPSVPHKRTEIPDVFTRTFDETWEYKPMDRIKEESVHFGAKKDEEGRAIRNILGSVIGRTGREIVVTHPGNVRENMIQVDSYVKWDPNHPNPDLLEIGELIQGDTGPEVRISQNMQPLAARAYEYSGWHHKRR